MKLKRRVVVIGAGIGGLSTAIRLARQGCAVTVVEARHTVGGLAAGFELEGFRFDTGAYVLLDRPGLEWALTELGIAIATEIPLQRIPEVYRVDDGSEHPVTIYDCFDKTAAEFERHWPGSTERYRRFIELTGKTYQRMQPMQRKSRPGIIDLLRSGAWRDVPFVLSSLESVLKSSHLPQPIVQALGIWTHVAGQSAEFAPSPLALVTSVIHRVGAYYPQGGIGRIAEVLCQTAMDIGVEIRLNTPVHAICCRNRCITGVAIEGATLPADVIISNVGLATYTRLLDEDGRSALSQRANRHFQSLPLQSPGVCAYLAVKGSPKPPYLKFRLGSEQDGCRLLVTPSVLDPALENQGWYPARLIAPMDHSRAESGGETVQREFLHRILEKEGWWRESFEDVRVLRTRIPNEWGSDFNLYRNSMNPVMTAKFMLTGRVAHRSPWIRNLYLTGSSTHPGQWISFCVVSGVLAADRMLADAEADQ